MVDKEKLLEENRKYEEDLKRAHEDYRHHVITTDEYANIVSDRRKKIDENIMRIRDIKEQSQEMTIQRLNKIIQSQDELIYKVGQTLLDLGKLCMLNNSANLLSGMKGDDNLNEHIESLMQEKEHYEEKLKKAQEDYINGILSDEEYTDIAADLKRKIDENVYEIKMHKDKQDEMAGIYRIACENYQDDEDIIGDDMMAKDEKLQELRKIRRALDKIYEVLTKPKGSG